MVSERRYTYQSAVNLHKLPDSVEGVTMRDGELQRVPVPIRDASGCLLASAVPQVRFVQSARYMPAGPELDVDGEVEILARLQRNLAEEPLAGFVAEGAVPNGNLIRVSPSAAAT